jgi:hypothetical protein
VVTEPPVVTKAPPPTRVAAKQPQEAKGLAGVGLTGEQVNSAIDRGGAFLWNYFKAREKKGGTFGAEGEYDLFYALALVKTGAHKRFPEFDAALRAYLPNVRPQNIGVYGSAVLCLLLESYGDPDYYPLLNQSARYLFEGQSAEGSWQYYPNVPDEVLRDPRSQKVLQVWGGRPTDGSPAERWARQAEPDRHEGGDNSVTQYAVLGLHAAAREGVEVPAETWKRVLNLYKSRQDKDGGWGYVNAGSAHSGSMTCAGLYSIAVARYHLGQTPHAEDENIERGLAWLSQNFAVGENPQAGTANHYYYLYSLERAGRTLETEFVGPHEWYPQGARFLVDAQKEDGSWVEPGPYETKPELSTSFALLFLTRGTSALTAARPTGGKGVLKTAGVEPAPPRVYFIFDCSGSMLDEENGRQRFDAAREALGSLLDALPEGTQVALRVYGHRKTARQAGADEDTELLVPMGPMDRADLSRRVQRLRARGKTPLALSLDEAAKDLAGAGKDSPCAVVLITDGGEDTMPRRDPVASAEALGRTPGVALHVVGFDIGRDDWGRQLRAMARAGHGGYWPATGGDALRRELRAALLRTPEQFVVADAAGKRFEGTFGRPLALPEGKYTLVTAYGGKEFAEPLWVNTGSTTAVMFDANRAERAPSSPARLPRDDAPVVGAKPRFCTHCGARLTAGSRFCTNCGEKVAQ